MITIELVPLIIHKNLLLPATVGVHALKSCPYVPASLLVEWLETANALAALALHGQWDTARLELGMVPPVLLPPNPLTVFLVVEEKKGAMAVQIVAHVK